MRIAFTADTHWGLREDGDLSTRAMVRSLKEEAPEVIVLGGDIASRSEENLRECLHLFGEIDAVRLFVAGNHDIWTREGDSEEIFRETLPRIGEECGFEYLEDRPWIADGIAIAGTMGWYDYSLRDRSLPYDTADYERKYVRRVCSWNDRHFVRWGHTDTEMADLLATELRRILEDLSRQGKRIVAVTHHLPFQELVVRFPDHTPWAFANAYLGSASLGRVLLQNPQITHHSCGHSHIGICFEKNSLRSVAVGSTYARKRYEILEI